MSTTKKKIKKLPRSQQLLSPVITDVSENKVCPFEKYATKYFHALGETSEKKIKMLAEGLKEIISDNTNYKIKLDSSDKDYEIIEKYIPNMPCPVTRKYLQEIVKKLKNDEDLTKVQEQVKKHIINGTRKYSSKPVPKVGDTVITDAGDKGTVTEKKGLNFKIKTNEGYITESIKNIISVKNISKEKIKEEKQLDNFFESFDFDKQIVNELFKDESDVEIEKKGLKYYFTVDENPYRVSVDGHEILFVNESETGSQKYVPVKNNKNQFIVLNAVLKCVRDILQTNKQYYYFNGDEGYGLAKLYTIMFNRLKSEAVNLGYVAINTNSLKDNDYQAKFLFSPKQEFTIDNYESILYYHPHAEFYGFEIPKNYIPQPEKRE